MQVKSNSSQKFDTKKKNDEAEKCTGETISVKAKLCVCGGGVSSHTCSANHLWLSINPRRHRFGGWERNFWAELKSNYQPKCLRSEFEVTWLALQTKQRLEVSVGGKDTCWLQPIHSMICICLSSSLQLKKHKPKGPVHQLCSFKMKVFSKKYVAENIAKLLQASTNTDIYPFLNLPILLSFRCFFE